MGKSPSKKTTTTKDTTGTSDSTQNTVTGQSGTSAGTTLGQTNVDVPDWLLNPAQKNAASFGALQGQDPTQFAPGISDLQNNAALNAGRLGLNNAGYLKSAETLRGVNDVGDVGSSSVLEGLDKYYTPFKDQVLNPVLNDYDVNSGKVRAQQAAQGAAGGAFGGSRFGVREAATEGELGRGRAATEGGLLGDMYTQATGLSEADAGRRQQTTLANQQTQLANRQTAIQKAQGQGALNQAINADDRSAISLQNTIGGDYSDRMNDIRQAPLTHQANMEGLFQGLDPSAYFGGSTAGATTGQQDTSGFQDTTAHENTTEHATGVSNEKSNPGLFKNIQNWMKTAGSAAKLAAAVGGA